MSAEMPKMPEPVAWRYLSDYPRCVYYIAGTPADNAEFLYTAAQMRAYAQQATRQAMERAAQAIEPKNDPSDWTDYAICRADCAHQIRALAKEQA